MMEMVGGMHAELDDVEMVPELVGGGRVLIARILAVQSALLRLVFAALFGGTRWR